MGTETTFAIKGKINKAGLAIFKELEAFSASDLDVEDYPFQHFNSVAANALFAIEDDGAWRVLKSRVFILNDDYLLQCSRPFKDYDQPSLAYLEAISPYLVEGVYFSSDDVNGQCTSASITASGWKLEHHTNLYEFDLDTIFSVEEQEILDLNEFIGSEL